MEKREKLMIKGDSGQSGMQGSRRDAVNEGSDPVGNEQEGGGARAGQART